MGCGWGCAGGGCEAAFEDALRAPSSSGGDAGAESEEFVSLFEAGARFLPRGAGPRRICRFVCMRRCLVSSSLRENRRVHPGYVHTYGLIPVWVRTCRVLCSSRRNPRPQISHLYGRWDVSMFEFLALPWGLSPPVLALLFETACRGIGSGFGVV